MSPITANALLLLAGLLWGGGFVAQRTAMDDIGPFAFMACRFLLAAAALSPFVMWEKNAQAATRPLDRAGLFSALWVGLAFFATMALQQIGLLATSVTNAGVLTGLYVVFTPMLAFVLAKDVVPPLIWPCSIAAFAGIWLLGGGGIDRLTWGDWLILAAAVFAALHVIAMGRAVKQSRRPAFVAALQFLISGTLALAFFAVARGLNWQAEPAIDTALLGAALPEILYAALAAGALAFTLMAICQQYTSAPTAAVLMSSEALFAALGGAIFLAERLDWMGYTGCALLMMAIAVASFASEAQSQPARPIP